MKTPGLFLVAAGAVFCSPLVHAQSILLKDGQTVQTLGIRRDGPSIAAKIKAPNGSEGELGYPVANIARIDFPEPPQRKAATDLLAQNKSEEAIRQLAPALTYYSPFRDVPGNWWTPLAFLQLDALSRLGRDRDVEALAGELAKLGSANPEILRAVKIRQGIALERKGKHVEALALLEPVVKDEDAPPQSTAEAWLNVGAAKLAQRKYQEALLAYLHVPVYTPDRTALLPNSMLGSAIAYQGMDDKTRAEAAFNELIAKYPTSPEAADAKTRLQKMKGPEADKTNSNG